MAILLFMLFLTKSVFALDVFTNFSRKDLEPILQKYKGPPLRMTYGWPELIRSNIEVRAPKAGIVWLRRRQDFEVFRETKLLQKIAHTDFAGIPEPFRDDEAVGIFIHPYVMLHRGKATSWHEWSKAKFNQKLCGEGDLAAEILALTPVEKPQFLKIWRSQQATRSANTDQCLVAVNSVAGFAANGLPNKYAIQHGGRLPFSLSAAGLIGDASEGKKFLQWLLSKQKTVANHFRAVATNPEIVPPSSVAVLLPKDAALGTLYASPF